MQARQPNHRFRWVELTVILGVVAIVLAVVVPAVLRARERSRRSQCEDNLKQIGLGLQNYNSIHERFPGSAELSKDSEGKTEVGGWSFLVKILPCGMGDCEGGVGGRCDLGMPPDEPTNISIREFVCPGFGGSRFVDPQNRTGAITNYKAMGATCQKSLLMVLGADKKPPYGTPRMHPDGALFPGEGLRVSDIQDGTAHTIICAETIDDRASRWTVGREVTLVGLPNSTWVRAEFYMTYYVPRGFDGTYGPGSAVSKPDLRAFLSYDFKGKDARTYEDAGFSAVAPAYGPSSAHVDVVNHLFADGAVRPIKRNMDPWAYLFMITRSGGDPFVAEWERE